MPHGDGRLFSLIEAGGTLSKKGEIDLSPAETKRREDRQLEIYSRVRAFFEETLGRPLLLLYGTLLGFQREGDIIVGDDDFDVGYVSDKTDPVAVKEETKEIIVELVRAGFTVSLNRRGRMFRVQLSPHEPGRARHQRSHAHRCLTSVPFSHDLHEGAKPIRVQLRFRRVQCDGFRTRLGSGIAPRIVAASAPQQGKIP